MCGPAAIPIIQASAVVIGTVFAVNSSVQQGRFQRGTAKYNARVAENQAEDVKTKGVQEENIQRRKTAELLSTQRAQLGASGVDLDSGSALQLQQDTVTLGEADALRIRSNALAQSGSLQTGATLTNAQGDFARAAGTNEAIGTAFSGTAAALDTGVADKWFTPKSAANQDLTLS